MKLSIVQLFVDVGHFDLSAIIDAALDFLKSNLCTFLVTEFHKDRADFGTHPLFSIPDDLDALQMRYLQEFVLHVFLELLKLVWRHFFFPFKDVGDLDHIGGGDSFERRAPHVELPLTSTSG